MKNLHNAKQLLVSLIAMLRIHRVPEQAHARGPCCYYCYCDAFFPLRLYLLILIGFKLYTCGALMCVPCYMMQCSGILEHTDYESRKQCNSYFPDKMLHYLALLIPQDEL